jgi:hypothetical protein
MSKLAQERNSKKVKKPLVDVTGGYDTLIEMYGETKDASKKGRDD